MSDPRPPVDHGQIQDLLQRLARERGDLSLTQRVNEEGEAAFYVSRPPDAAQQQEDS